MKGWRKAESFIDRVQILFRHLLFTRSEDRGVLGLEVFLSQYSLLGNILQNNVQKLHRNECSCVVNMKNISEAVVKLQYISWP